MVIKLQLRISKTPSAQNRGRVTLHHLNDQNDDNQIGLRAHHTAVGTRRKLISYSFEQFPDSCNSISNSLGRERGAINIDLY